RPAGAGRAGAASAFCAAICGLPLRLELLLELAERPVTRQNLVDTRVGLALIADGREEFAVLQLDAVHRDVDLPVLAVDEIVVACDVGAVVADVAEEGTQRPVIVE